MDQHETELNPFPYRLIETETGLMVTVANDMLVDSVLELYGEYSGDEADLLTTLCNPGEFVLDVGAHIGCLTIALAERVGPGGRVVAFEPQDKLYRALKANLTFRRLDHVEVNRVAAASGPSVLKVHNEGGSLMRNYGASRLGSEGVEEVEARSIDSYNFPPCQLAKIDVEGMELDVLKGAGKTIDANSIVYFENSIFDESSDLFRSHALLQHFLDRGYQLFWHLPHFVSRKRLPPSGIDVFKSGGSFNVLALPASKKDVAAVAIVPEAILRPISSPDAIAFPKWLDPRLIRRVVYDQARARGAAPLRPGDDPERPWIALYEGYLEFLRFLAEDRSLAAPPHPGTRAGWAAAELWFTLTERDLSNARIIAVGLPPVFVVLASSLCPVVVVDPFVANEPTASDDRITTVRAITQISDEDCDTIIVVKGTVHAAMAAMKDLADRPGRTTFALAWVTDEGSNLDIRLAPPIWQEGGAAGIAVMMRTRSSE